MVDSSVSGIDGDDDNDHTAELVIIITEVITVMTGIMTIQILMIMAMVKGQSITYCINITLLLIILNCIKLSFFER